MANLHELNNLEISRVIWDCFGEFARSQDAKESSKGFRLEEVGRISFAKCEQVRLIPPNVQNRDYPPFRYIVRKIYFSAINMGLIIPGRIDQALDWDLRGLFQFTFEGINYFSEGFISIDDPGHLGIALKELQKRLPSIDDGKIELLLESQRCIKAKCYRAGMVVIGVCNEDMCLALLDAIPINCNPPGSGDPLFSDWKNCIDTNLAFSMRWKPGIRLLETIKNNLRKPGRGEPWWQWWEMVPGSLYTLGEAVRIARNSAAHDSTRSFSKSEVALLLSAMPIQLEMLARLTEFLETPHANLIPIQF